MGLNQTFVTVEPQRSEIDALSGATLLEFGAPWCEHCQAAQPLIAQAFAGHAAVRHIRVEDGKGRPLGRMPERIRRWGSTRLKGQSFGERRGRRL